MKRSFASLLVVIFALCTVPSLSVADATTPPIQYAEDHELTPYSFESIQDIQITMNRYIDASKQNVSKAAQALENMLFSDMKTKDTNSKNVICTNGLETIQPADFGRHFGHSA